MELIDFISKQINAYRKKNNSSLFIHLTCEEFKQIDRISEFLSNNHLNYSIMMKNGGILIKII